MLQHETSEITKKKRMRIKKRLEAKLKGIKRLSFYLECNFMSFFCTTFLLRWGDPPECHFPPLKLALIKSKYLVRVSSNQKTQNESIMVMGCCVNWGAL